MTQDNPMVSEGTQTPSPEVPQTIPDKTMLQRPGQSRTGSLILGILMIVTGIAAIALPFAASLAFTFWLGWVLIVMSLVKFAYAFQSRNEGGTVMKFLLSVLYLVAGVMLVAQPLQGIVTLTLLLGSFLVVEGISELVLAYQLRSRVNWGWVLFNGILTLVLGGLIWSGWPLNSPWVIGTLVGLSLGASGISRVMLAAAPGNFTETPTAA